MPAWYERAGMQINRPPKRRLPDDYERPSMWRLMASALWVLLPVYFGTFAVVVGVLVADGRSFWHAWPFGLLAATTAQFAVEVWWRRNRPPSEDRVSTLFSKHPEDYV